MFYKDERDQAIVAEGVWYGIGVAFLSFTIVVASEATPPIKDNWWVGILIGIIFIGCGFAARKIAARTKEHKTMALVFW